MSAPLAPERAKPLTPALEKEIADYLMQLLGDDRPRRVARMLDPGKDKYRDVPRHVPLDRAKLERHASGAETWAATLALGSGRIGAADIERDTPEAGHAELLARYRDVRAAGLQAIAIYVENTAAKHYGGHIFGFYAEACDPQAIAAQWRGILPSVREIWPCSQVIRLPLGYHRWAKKRGELWYLTDAGELLTIDLDRDLAGGFALIEQLPTNAAPPRFQVLSGSDKGHYAKSCLDMTRRAPVHAAPGGRTSLADVKAQFNASHTWPELLGAYGGSETRDGWACNCGAQHSHATQIAVTSQDKIVSFSPNCGWAPHRSSGRALDKFGFYVLIAHGDNIAAALAALNPIAGAPEKAPELLDTRDEAERWASQHAVDIGPDYVLAPAELERRKAEAQRKRVARAFHAQETIADVRSRAARDEELTDTDRAVLEALLTIAGDRGWCRPSKERIAELSGVPLGTVKRAMFSAEKGGRLEGRYFVSEGKGGGAKLTAIRTFLRGSIAPELIHESYSTCDLIPESRAGERRATDPAELLERLSFASYLRNLAAELGEVLDLAELAALSLAEQEACEARLKAQLADLDQPARGLGTMVPNAAPAPAAFDDSGQPECASYTPVESPSHRPYSGRNKHALDTEARYALVWETMRRRPEVEPAAQPEQLLDVPRAPEPRPNRNRPSAIDRYVVDLARMPEAELAGELKKHRATLKKHRGAQWLGGIRDRLGLVENEIDARDRYDQVRRRRSAAIAAPADVSHLQLELVIGGDSATGFARALVEGSPPLTSSECLGVQLTL